MIAIFRYEDGKMHFMANAHSLFASSVDKKPFGSEFEFNGTYYITTGGLFAITDFSDPSTWKKIPVSQRDVAVRDALLWDGTIYVLASYTNRGPTQFTESYTTVIYKSTTGQEGSFEEVLSFDYPATALCFEYDGAYFYIGTGSSVNKDKTGMVLRAKSPA